MIQNVARNRVNKILNGKKRIDSGVPKIDETANASIEERIDARKKRNNKIKKVGDFIYLSVKIMLSSFQKLKILHMEKIFLYFTCKLSFRHFEHYLK